MAMTITPLTSAKADRNDMRVGRRVGRGEMTHALTSQVQRNQWIEDRGEWIAAFTCHAQLPVSLNSVVALPVDVVARPRCQRVVDRAHSVPAREPRAPPRQGRGVPRWRILRFAQNDNAS